jgi:predicted nucleic acid-binding protein
MAGRAVIADASALIALAQIERLALFENLFGQILVTPAVAREVAPSILTLPPWVVTRGPWQQHDRILAAGLGPGETEVLSLALEMASPWLILDDLDARRLAHSLGLRTLGTAAVLVEAKRAGFVESVRPLLDLLIQKGFRLAPTVYQTILRIAGEADART